MIQLYPYQAEAFTAIERGFREGRRSQLLVMATGTGKTYVFLFGAQAVLEDGNRVLVLVHRDELLQQAINGAMEVGLEAVVEKADDHACPRFTRFGGAAGLAGLETTLNDDPKLVIASVQTLQRKRLKAWPNGYFHRIITDECFPAGTLVDGKPIETIRPGDIVYSYDHREGLQRRRVARTFKNPSPATLLRVRFESGRYFDCTPEHPIWCVDRDRYLPARHLESGSVVATITLIQRVTSYGNSSEDVRCLRDSVCSEKLEQYDDSGMFPGVQGGSACREGEGRHSSVQPLREDGGVSWQVRAGWSKAWESVLLRRLQDDPYQGNLVCYDGTDESPVCIGANDESQSDEASRREGQGEHLASRDGMEASGTGREWEGSDASAIASGVNPWMGHGGQSSDDHWEQLDLSVLLQTGYRMPSLKTGDRGGWTFTWGRCRPSQGREEDSILGIDRVDRVEVLQRGGDGASGALHGDGSVYNLEVEGNHNYFANGVLVHNCHHSAADSYRAIIDHFQPKEHLGVTATWDRGDKKPIVGPEQVFETVAFEYSMWDAVQQGWLARPVVRVLDCNIDLRGIRTTAGDFNAGDLEELISPKVEELCRLALPHIEGRTTLVFTPDCGSAELVASAFREMGVGAASVRGSDTDRGQIVADFRNRKYQVVSNCQLFTEGTDFPFVDCIISMRPTKSRPLFVQQIGRGTRKFPGKADCIAEGSLVLTDVGMVPIEQITPGMLVWDGCDFVSHQGAICRGEQEVIGYAGIEATPDHNVWTGAGWRTFRECAKNAYPIAVTGVGGSPIRMSEGLFRGDCGAISSPVVQTKRRVWDILNAGPHHRFTVEGLLVSNCRILAYNWKTVGHKLVKPAEIFTGPGLDPLDIDGAQALVENGLEDDLMSAVKKAKVNREEEEERKERGRLKAQIKNTTAKRVKSWTFDPLAVDPDSIGGRDFDETDTFTRRATDKQLVALEKFGYKPEQVVEWTVHRASKTLDALIRRREAGLASVKQVSLLKKYGYSDVETMTFAAANELIGRLAANNWRKVG